MKKFLVGALAVLFLIGCSGEKGNTPENQADYEEEINSAKEDSEKLEISMEYCDIGVVNACYNVVIKLKNSKDKDDKKIFDYYKKSCEVGGALACKELGIAYMTPADKGFKAGLHTDYGFYDNGNSWYKEAEYDIEKATNHFKKACEYESKYCSTIADFYFGDNRGVVELLGEEKAKSLANYDEAANYTYKYFAGTKYGCDDDCYYNIAIIIYLKRAKSIMKANNFAEIGCSKSKDGRLCRVFAQEFEKRGDLIGASNFSKKGCDRGDRDACYMYNKKYKDMGEMECTYLKDGTASCKKTEKKAEQSKQK